MQHVQPSVNEIMTHRPVFALAVDTVFEAESLCHERGVHYLLIADEEGDLIGVTCRCHLRRAPQQARVVEVTRRPAVYIRSGEPVSQALLIMDRCAIGCLPVINANGTVEGVVTRHDFRIAGFGTEEQTQRCARCRTSHNLKCSRLEIEPIYCETCLDEMTRTAAAFGVEREEQRSYA